MSSAPKVLHDHQLYARLLGYVKPYRLAFAGTLLAMAIGGAVEGSFIWFLRYMLETLFSPGNEGYAAIVAIGIVIVFLIIGISHFISGYGMQWVGNKIILDFRNQMFQRLIRMPVPYFDETTIGTLMSKVTTDVIGLQDAVTTALNAAVRGGFTLVTVLGSMFVLNWKLTLITFASVPILGYIIKAFGRRLRQINHEGQRANAGITDVLEESIRGQKVIKIFGGETYEGKRFGDAANRIRRINMKQSAAAAASTPFTHLIVSMAIALIVYLAIGNHLGPMSPPDFVAFIVAAAALPTPIKGLAGINERMQKGLAAAESVFALIDAQPEQDSGTIALDRARGHVVFNDVVLQYPNQPIPALDKVSLEIHPGETIALVGPSGGGKTSFINLIPRFFQPTAGTITLDGHGLNDIRLADLRRQVALVSQDVVLFNDTVAANIAYGCNGEAARDAVAEAARAANCLDFINALPNGLDTVIGDNGMRLSGGQRQRLAIARALFKNAPILLLDEATSALDSESERAVQEALNVLMRGRTTLVVAHRLSTIENADRIVVMEQGRIVECGPHRELIGQNGLYASLHRLQFATA
jgi:subfamily B ATP-binding cassette protein MsbA